MLQGLSDLEGEEVTVGGTNETVGERIGDGAEGYIYELASSDSDVVKIFKNSIDNKEEKVEYLVENEMFHPPGADTPDEWTRWPTELVYGPSSNEFLGYQMRYLDVSEYLNAQLYAEEELLRSGTTQRDRLKPAINLCLTVLWLHENGYAVGDISDQNVRIRDGTVTIIDCDSFSVEYEFPGAEMEAFRYRPPEGVGSTHHSVRMSDRYGVAVHIFQFLMEGVHPCQATGDDNAALTEAIDDGTFAYGPHSDRGVSPPDWAPNFDTLPESIRVGFIQCFDKGYDTPNARPTLNEWLGALTSELGMELTDVPTEPMDYDVDRGSSSGDWYEEFRADSEEDTQDNVDVTTSTAESGTSETEWEDIRDEYSDEDSVTTDSSSTSSPTASSSSSDDTVSISVDAAQAIGIVLFVLFILFLFGVF